MHVFECRPISSEPRCGGDRLMAFKASRDQLVRRDRLAADLSKKAIELNAAIEKFNRQLEPLVRAVAEAQSRYDNVMESARTLASEISTPAQDAFDAKSQRWQDSDVGIQ